MVVDRSERRRDMGPHDSSARARRGRHPKRMMSPGKKRPAADANLRVSTPLPLRLPARPPLRLVLPGYARRDVPGALHGVEPEARDPSAAWVDALRGTGHAREEAVARLH